MERGGGRIQDCDKKFKMINVVVFGKYKIIVHDSTSIMNVEACKISLGMHTMSASEAGPCVCAAAGPPQLFIKNINCVSMSNNNWQSND